jgi:hypothetical protein
MSPHCNVKRFMEANLQVSQKPGWYWVIGSVGFHGDRGRFVFRPLAGPGLDIIKSGEYRRVLLNLADTIVDVSVAKIERGRLYLVLPREYNHIWRQLYGSCQIGYVIPKRLFLLLTDQLVGDWANIYIYRRGISPRLRA